MSWRFLIAILLVAAGASALGGVRLGDWLVAHGPVAPPVTAELHPELSTMPVLDANGQPYVAQPPQPLVDGRLAVPEPVANIAWQIPTEPITEGPPNAMVDLATTPITMEEAISIASNNDGLQGIADVGDLGLDTASMTAGSFNRGQPLQPIDVPAPPPPPAATPAPADNAWQASLRQELQACSAQGFFDRPSCAWAARNKYCAPNNAWGRTGDCPAKKF